MASTRREPGETPAKKRTRRSRAATPEARESQLIAMAYDETERQILAGTASSQMLTHFLKLGSSRERTEQIKLQRETELLSKKVEGMESAKRVESMYEEALQAMRAYSGTSHAETFDDQGGE